MNVDPKVLAVRAGKTFVQAALGYLTIALSATNLPTSTVAWRALLVGAASAGFSAIINLFVKPQEAK